MVTRHPRFAAELALAFIATLETSDDASDALTSTEQWMIDILKRTQPEHIFMTLLLGKEWRTLLESFGEATR